MLGLLVLSIAAHARAGELQLGLSSEYVHNSNFFSNENDEDAANSFLIGPEIGIYDLEGRLRYDLEFIGAYQAYVDQSGVDAWESRLRARATYEIDARTSVRVTERFRDVSNLRFSRLDIALADTALDPNQDRYFRNDLEVELIRDLSRNFELRLIGAHHWIDFEDNIDRNDSQAFDIGSELRYRIAPEHDVGAGISYTNQDFEESLTQLASRGEYVNSYLTWIWDISEAIQFTVNGGPSWVRSDEADTTQTSQTRFVGGNSGGDLFRAALASCNVIDPVSGNPIASSCDFVSAPPIPANDLGPIEAFSLARGERVGTASELTFFGGASIQANLAEWTLQAIYSRRQSTTSGDGLASSLDRVSLELDYAPPKYRWSVFVAGSWDRRETLTEATVVDFTVVDGGDGAAQRDAAFTEVENGQSRLDAFTAITGLRTAFTRNHSATLEFRYRRTEGRNRGFDRPDVDTFFFVFSLDYTLDAIRF